AARLSCHRHGAPRHPRAFPTRRSSDLTVQVLAWADLALGGALEERVPGLRARIRREARIRVFAPYLARRDWHWLHGAAHNWTGRSEEHTSELQSRFDLVCRLLLEKKKK